MKKFGIIVLVLALICALVVGYCVLNDPFSLNCEDVASIEYTHTERKYDESSFTEYEATFVITDENHIRYITDFLNNLLPIPGEVGYADFPRVLTFRDNAGNVLTQVTIPNHDAVTTERGTFLADMSELNSNLSSIEEGEAIFTNMMALPFYLICFLIVAVLGGILALLIFLFQMGVCYQTDIFIVRLIPAAISLTVVYYFHYVFYIVLLFNIEQWDLIYRIVAAVCVLSLILGWRQGDIARNAKS